MEKRVSRVKALPKLAPEFRVAAYARVSSEKDAMRHSLSMQVSYEYWCFIKLNSIMRDKYELISQDIKKPAEADFLYHWLRGKAAR